VSKRVRLLSASYEHFLGFRDKVELPLCDLGLVMVRGENRHSAATDSNGSGKTALIVDGPAWVLFGETLRGLRADAVACRFTKERAVGTLLMEVGGERVSIIRTTRPSTLTVSSQSPDLSIKEQQAAIDSMLGWGFRTYRNAVVFGQGNFDRFAQADQADQLRMLDEIQGMDLRAARERAKAWADAATAKLDEAASNVRQCRAIGEEVARQLEEMERQRVAFTASKAQRVAEAERLVQHAATNLADARLKVAAVESARARLPALQAALTAMTILEDTVNAARQVVRGAEMENRAAQALAMTGERDLAALLGHGTCPTCRSKFDPTVTKRVQAAFAPDIATAKRIAAKASVELTRAQADVAAAEKALRGASSVSATQVGQVQAAASERADADAKRAVQLAEDLAKEADQSVAVARAETWTGASAVEAAHARGVAAQASVVDLEAQVRRAEVTIVVAEYWLEAFGDRGIRSLIFDSVAGFLNDRLAYHLSALAAGEVSVAVSALPVLKGGGALARVSVSADWSGVDAGKGTGSAGQDRRVDLALFAALQDLAEARSGRPFPLQVWDEPGDALDAKGQELFARWVEREARARGTGFLITHSQALVDAVQPDRTWVVVMERDGAHLEMTG